MSQPSSRSMSQPFFIPTLMPMQQHQVVISSSSGVVAPVISTPPTAAGFGQAQSVSVIPTSAPAMQRQPIISTANLYLCNISNNSSEPPPEDVDNEVKKVSIEILEESYKELNSRKVKDTLSSFLPDVPGEFDCTESVDTKLKHLLDQRSTGSKEFHPLSGHALLGFRLLPGSLPEKFRIDPPSQDMRPHHHHKKKHKHRNIEKGSGEERSDFNTPASKVKIPNDAYSFIKVDSPSLHIGATPTGVHGYTNLGPDRPLQGSSQKVGSGVIHSGYTPAVVPTPTLTSGGPLLTHDSAISQFTGKKKKDKKKSKEEKKKRKEKKKKKEKHHSQDPPGPPTGPAPSTHPPPTY